CRLAAAPTSRSPSSVKATTEGVVRPPSSFGITTGCPPSITATTELVVPRSMPITLPEVGEDGEAIYTSIPLARRVENVARNLGPRSDRVKSGDRGGSAKRRGPPRRDPVVPAGAPQSARRPASPRISEGSARNRQRGAGLYCAGFSGGSVGR